MRFWERVGRISPPLVVGLGGLLLWELVLRVVQPGGFVLPPPSEILASVVENREVIWTAVLSTGWIVITGLISGVVIGIILSVAVSWYRLADEAITPLAVAISAIDRKSVV